MSSRRQHSMGISAVSARGSSRAVGVVRVLAVCTALALLSAGCAKNTPLADVGASGADIYVLLRTTDGESITGTLVSLDARAMVVETRQAVAGDTMVRERDGVSALYSGVDRLPGEVVDVESSPGGRVAVLHRTFRAVEIESATFHEARGQRSLAKLLSHIVGPVVGGTLGFIF